MFVARREDPVHLYYNFIRFLVIPCSVYAAACEIKLLGFVEAKIEIPCWVFSKTLLEKQCLVGSLTGVVAS
jgi:hypothetical protein